MVHVTTLYESFGLTHEQMSRGCDLLVEAGFIRGFDEQHLKQTLDTNDYDYRFSFAQALDRLALGLIMPEASAMIVCISCRGRLAEYGYA